MSYPDGPTVSGYVLAEASDVSGGGATPACRHARWDPNCPDALGATLEDGSFRYLSRQGAARRLRLYAATAPLAAWPRDDEPIDPGRARPVPNRTPWAHWTFVPGQVAAVAFVHAYSKQLLLGTLPRAGERRATRVMLVRELPRPSPVSALAVCTRGEWVGVGQEDGTVSFFLLGALLTELPRPEDEAMASEHAAAHGGAISCVTLLRASIPELGVEAALGCTGSSDQVVLVWDLGAGAALHRILTANPSPLSACALALLPPGTPATGRVPEPTVLLCAGSADGGVQAWALTGGSAPVLRACWRHRAKARIGAIEYAPARAGRDGSDARVVSVSLAADDDAELPDGGRPFGVIEEHETAGWALVAAHAIADGALVSADFEPVAPGGGAVDDRHTDALGRLLIGRASGMLSRWARPSADEADEASQPPPPYSHEGAVAVAEDAEDAEDAESTEDAEDGTAERWAAMAALPMGQQPPPPPPDEDAAPRSRVPQATSPSQGAAARDVPATAARGSIGVVPLPPRPAPAECPPAPEPLPSPHFDNPYRILSLLGAAGVQVDAGDADADADFDADADADEAGGTPGGGSPGATSGGMAASAHPLARPSINSSVRFERERSHVAGRTFEREALPLIEDELQRQARREATPILNTPASKVDRYANLTPLLDPTTASPPARPARRPARAGSHREHHAPWLAMRALEPMLDDLWTVEREAEIVDTRRDAQLPLDHTLRDADPGRALRARSLSLGRSGSGLVDEARPLDLGDQLPLF